VRTPVNDAGARLEDGVGALDDGGDVGRPGAKRLGAEFQPHGEIGPALTAMGAGPLAAGLGNEVGVGRLRRIAEMAVDADQSGVFRIALRRSAVRDFADGPHAMLCDPPRILARGVGQLSRAAAQATRIPVGHPEGCLEAFAQIYRDTAEQVAAMIEGRAPDRARLLVPIVKDGARGIAFVAACVESRSRCSTCVVPEA